MAPGKRMRIFAGPNGSGKTTIFKKILEKEKIHLGVYVNADDIEQALSVRPELQFSKFKIEVTEEELRSFLKESNFSLVKRNQVDLPEKLSVKENLLSVNTHIDSYLCADLAEFIRRKLLQKGESFTYETVMSHRSKLDFIQLARDNGYRVYLYYIATADPDINVNRVEIRVNQDGHNVSPEIITSRYFKSLSNLKEAVQKTNRAYIFDNSGTQAQFIAEISEGTEVALNDAATIPAWVETNLFK